MATHEHWDTDTGLQLLSSAGIDRLPDGWTVRQLGSMLAAERGVAVGVMYPGEHTQDGIPLIRAGELTGSVINDRPEYLISPEVHDEYRRTALEGGELLITLVGDVGLCAVVPDSMRGWNAARALAVVRLANPSDAAFVRLCLISPPIRHLMRVWCNTTVQATLNLKDLRLLPIPWPPAGDRAAMVRVLRSLDDKIEQNRRTGAKLEGLARGVFKAWFVDFEPVKAKAAGATAFPGMPPETFAALPARFEDSELGPVPEGWEVKTAGELASFILGGDWGKDTPTEETPDPAHCIRGADIPDLWANGLGKMPVRYLKRGSLQKRSLRAGDIAVEISGGSPTQSTGRPVLVTDALLAELPHPLVCSNFCRIFRPKQHHTNFTYFLFRWMYDAEQFLQYENGTTGIKNFAFTKFCEVHQVVMPHESLLASFDVWIEPLMRAMAHTGSESRRLATLRDYLLPRLLSGRVRVRGEIT